MRYFAIYAILALPLGRADFAFYFAGNGGNESAPFECKGLVFECSAPSICIADSSTGREYCCAPGEDGRCVTAASGCESTKLNGAKVACSDGTCCVEGEEQCREDGQDSLCETLSLNPASNLNATALKAKTKHLIAEDPSAFMYSFTVDQDLLLDTAVPIYAAGAYTQHTLSKRASKLSGGAIAGIVVGGLVGLVLLAAFCWFMLILCAADQDRRNMHKKSKKRGT